MPFTDLLPAGLDATMALALIVLSFVTSLITATFSLGGGTLMVAVLALVFPPAVVVPLHGAIQLGSNGGRAIVQRAHVQWHLVLWLALGGAIGTVIGGQFASLLPATALQVAIAAFVLLTTWLPQPRIVGRSRVAQVVGGAVISALSMVVGATGPLVAVFIKGLADRRHLVATHAMLMTLQNTFKVVVFVFLGFAFAEYLPLIVAMVVSGFGGTALGSRLLVKVPEAAFRWGFKIVLTVVALDLLREAIF
ncbi:sulfite exporter TauE/SafE family protein [Devosia sp. ZB163]|uniref:sulfite exporter TauE/SafE family protein n=1 Tax=Devosia sp. ZB163 TaxID=3025938 RepID=UPI00235FD3E4|nr:sulfite exporter TauE/SafE family protein [Devosia sp. ZB163]MDC9823848.1 sulfite exporter TauE/SafE family protein [Devosia sp. ZB163]